MSDSASRKDVEDVLSSVRRLVSNETPRNRRPDLPEGPGALVLTDAQRVEKPAAKGPVARSLEDRIAELEAAVSSRDDEYEPDGSEDQAQHRPDRIVYSRPPRDDEDRKARGDALRLNRLSLVESGTPQAEPETHDDDPPAESPRARFRHARRAASADPGGADAPEQEAPMAENVTDAPDEKTAEVRPFHDPDDMVGRFEARMDGDDLPPPPGPGHNGFSERLEPYEASLGAEPETSAPATDELAQMEQADDADFEAALSEAVARPADKGRAAPVTGDAIEGASSNDAEAAPPSASATAESPDDIDEDLLRPLVAKLIREELQGELGERITRNVRKLVRREILRAINSRELE